MSRTATQGERLLKSQFLQLIKEAEPGTYDADGDRAILTSVTGDFQPQENWDSFRPDGFNVDAWHSLSKSWNLYSGNIRWDYAQGFTLEELLAGVAVLTDPAPDDAEEGTWYLGSHDARPIQTFTLEYGQPDNCDRCTYGILVSISQNLDRDANSVDGQMTLLCRKPEASGVAMTGSIARNSKYKFTAANGNEGTALVVSVLVAGGGMAQEVTIHAYDDEATIAAAFAALDDVDAVDVTDAVTEVAKVFRFHPTSPSGNYQINGMVAKSLSDNLAAWQTALRNTGGNFANATLGGTITAPTPGTVVISGATGTGASYVNGTYTLGANYGGHKAYYNGTDSVMYWSDAGGGVWQIESQSGGGARQTSSNPVPETTPPTSGWSGSNGGSGTLSVTVNAATGAALDITITIPLTATNPNPSTPAVTGTNSSGAMTVQTHYSGVGDIDVEFTDPGNRRVTVAKVSGDDWTVTETQHGSDGSLAIPVRVPILPNQFGIRVASSRAGLDSADLVPAVKKFTWGIDSLVEAVFFAVEGELSFQSHADDPDGRKTTLTLLLGSKSTLCATLNGYAAEQPSAPFWIEARCLKGDDLNIARRQYYVAVSAAKKRTAAGKIMAWEYTLMPVLTDAPLTADPIANGGASQYTILRRAA